MAQGSTALSPAGLREARKLGLRAAAKLFGGGRAAADALHVNERSWRAWVGGDREIANSVVLDTAAALEARACECRERARKLRELAGAGHIDKAPAEAASLADEDKARMRERFLALPRETQLAVASGRVELAAALAEHEARADVE